MFNTIGKDFTIFIKQNNKDGLHNIFIHDTREKISQQHLSQKGKIINTDLVTKFFKQGSNTFSLKTKNYQFFTLMNICSTLIKKVIIIFTRWKSPSERTLDELMFPDKTR